MIVEILVVELNKESLLKEKNIQKHVVNTLSDWGAENNAVD